MTMSLQSNQLQQTLADELLRLRFHLLRLYSGSKPQIREGRGRGYQATTDPVRRSGVLTSSHSPLRLMQHWI